MAAGFDLPRLGGLLVATLLVYFVILTQLSSPTFGVGQRIFLGVEWLWIELVAIRLYRISKPV